MDVLKIKTKFMRAFISKLLENYIKDKLRYSLNIDIEDIDIVVDADKAHTHLIVNADIPVNELKKIEKLVA